MNKVPSEEIAKRLKTELEERQIDVIGCIYLDADIFKSSLDGRMPANGVAVREVKDVLDRILVKAGLPALG
jgi:CO dehydrogenase nickel-insertion accessory protein CooC1